jgi:hypothetical protein
MERVPAVVWVHQAAPVDSTRSSLEDYMMLTGEHYQEKELNTSSRELNKKVRGGDCKGEFRVFWQGFQKNLSDGGDSLA